MAIPDPAQALWDKHIAKLLGERSFATLCTTADGIVLYPLYQHLKGPRAEPAHDGPWGFFQRLDHASGGSANAQALEDLAGGATGLSIIAKDSPGCYGFGLIHPSDIAAALHGVPLHSVSFRIEGGGDWALHFANFVARQPIDAARLNVAFMLDDEKVIADLRACGFRGPFIMADGRAAHAHGATEAQELAIVLQRLWHGLTQFGEASYLSATLTANQQLFSTIAKFRALRLLWARALEVMELEAQPLLIHAETSHRMMAKVDPHSNMLRTTVAGFAACLGGADSLSVLPFSIAQGLPNAFSRRMARNTQLILSEESQLWRVADPASGAGYVEHFTASLCEKAWGLFQQMERTHQPLQLAHDNPTSLPVIGVSAYPLERESEAAIEPYP